MKVFFLILFSFVIIYSTNAQEFEIHFADTIGYGQPGGFFIVEGHATNLSSTDTLTLTMVRLQNILPSPLWSSSICLGVCAAPFVDSIAWAIPPDTSELCSVDFFSDSIPSTASVLIRFATLNNSQVEEQWFIGSTMLNGIKETNSHSLQNFKLFSNYPNPFNNQTIISAQIDRASNVVLQIFDVLGREIFNTNREISSAGKVTFRWNGLNNNGEELSSGIYFYRVTANSQGSINQSQIKKLTLLR